MYRFVVRARFTVQVLVLNLSFALHGLRRRRADDPDWIVGPHEVAGMVHQLAQAIPSSLSVLLARHPYFAHDYGWTPGTRAYPGAVLLRVWFLAPWKFGELARRARGFVYISGEGFIHAAHDNRHYEFRFLRRHGLKIVCYFTGNDIRSPKLMRQLQEETGRPNLGTYLGEVNRVFESNGYDDVKRSIADAANRYADAVFSADVDQRSYLTGASHPFQYFHADDDVAGDFHKFDGMTRPVIVHAPSSPILKGTPLVRAAIAELRAEGYEFDYIELTRVTNAEVRSALERAHIVLNEFYAYVPGVFGVEAMAAGCALLTSADETIERQLPAGSNEAWSVTEHYRIVANLRELLDDPARARDLAERGRDWVRRHAVTSVSGAEIQRVLADVLARQR
jgi:Glycosyl transferases group 1